MGDVPYVNLFFFLFTFHQQTKTLFYILYNTRETTPIKNIQVLHFPRISPQSVPTILNEELKLLIFYVQYILTKRLSL